MRRGHGSTKVPGVKLRPAASSSKSRASAASSSQTVWKDITYADVDDSVDILQSSSKPFAKLVLSSSGVTDKLLLQKKATQLGAKFVSDLTDQVTHLISEGTRSAKYAYCVGHGIPIMHPSWITNTYEKWISGENLDVSSNVSIHRLKTFTGVRMFVTAIHDSEVKTDIRKRLEKGGGVYVEEVRKDSHPTHLLCGPDREAGGGFGLTEKMRTIQKLNAKSENTIHMVWDDWFWDCINFRGLLNEHDYDATNPRPKRKEVRDVTPNFTPLASTAEPRSQDRADLGLSAGDDEELVLRSKNPEATQKLWESLFKTRGIEVKGGKLTRSPTRASTNTKADSDPSSTTSNLGSNGQCQNSSKSTLNSAFSRTKSFAHKSELTGALKAERDRQKPRATTCHSSKAVSPAELMSDRERKLFEGLVFRALGSADEPHIARAIEARGGIFVSEVDSDVDIILVRLSQSCKFLSEESRASEREKFRTECWLEQCIFEERICEKDENPAYQPLRSDQTIEGVDKLVLHISGVTASERTSAVRLIKAIGAQLTDKLTRQNTHLICPCGEGPKYSKALEWEIPVVNLQWLFNTVTASSIANEDSYRVTKQNFMDSEIPPISDITNSRTPSRASNSSSGPDNKATSTKERATGPRPYEATNDWEPSELLFDNPQSGTLSSPSRKLSNLAISSNPVTPSHRIRQITEATGSSSRDLSSPSNDQKAIRETERVSSSATPSPLKMPSSANNRTSAASMVRASSITTPTISEGSAAALKDTLVSLLGKRTSSEDHGPHNASNNEAPSRANKRSKPPPRSKSSRTFSRTGSVSDVALGRSGSSLTSLSATEYPLLESFETPAELKLGDSNQEDDSMRVTYEDPSQRDAEQQLQKLFQDAATAGTQLELGETHDERVLTDVKDEMNRPAADPERPTRRGKNLVRRLPRTSDVA